MFRRVILIASLAALGLVGGGPASAASAATPSATVRACTTGDTPDARNAIFYGRMKTLGKTETMRMRFTVFQRFGDSKVRSVLIPELRTWRNSKPGVRVFGYAQTVAGLEAGGEYRARVEFRWLDKDGNLLRRSAKLTKPCKMPGDLADLGPLGATSSAGPVLGTSIYTLTIRNRGKVAARDIAVELFVDGAATDLGHIDVLEPGQQKEVRISGPLCQRRLRVVVDPNDVIHEESELDNSTILQCP
ncbi:MAG: CARDB domain-containing protein [Thermoleophilaceae bacterium]